MLIDHIFLATCFSLYFLVNIIFYIIDTNEKSYYITASFNYLLTELLLFFIELIFVFIINNYNHSAIIFLVLHILIFLFIFSFLFYKFTKTNNFFENYYSQILIGLGFFLKSIFAISWNNYLEIFISIKNSCLTKLIVYVTAFASLVISLSLILNIVVNNFNEISLNAIIFIY